jgi:plasmid stabilization system protein ParE
MRVRWTDDAVHDLTHICDYIEKHGSAASARGVAISIHNAIDLLARFPEYGRTGRSRTRAS